MELCEFAEQVLFATTLEEKLQCPAEITDERPGLPLVAPLAPGRPDELRFKPTASAKVDFPGVQRLEQEGERGRVLHFFAGQELLATELLALALLRFPNAPGAFRRELLQTLEDEQEHTRLYLRRLRECGTHFGARPISGHFWHAISRVETPLEFVAGLGLTFEQANLDVTRFYARAFTSAGDALTAGLLERIYHDEIGHVASGLKWFRRWKNPRESDWEAFCRHLKSPLSPQHAKGPVLNVEGRRAAGLEPAFIAQLNVYARSRGRTPTVFLFNPFTEGRIAQGKAFTPVKHQVLLARDLANLPQYLCRQDDLVLVEHTPSVEFLSGLKQAGFVLPEFVEFDGARVDAAGVLAQRRLGGLRPWAWGPDSIELLGPLFPRVAGGRFAPRACFNEAIARLYSKTWSAGFLAKILRSHREPWLCTEQEVGIPAETLEAALAAIAEIRRRGHHKVVVKEAVGLAGHNAIRLWEPQLLEAQRRWIEAALQEGRQVLVEPWLEREMDFSAQLEMGTEGLKLCGYTGLINDRKGQYQANWAATDYDRRLPEPLTRLFHDPPDFAERLPEFYAGVFSLLAEELRAAGYCGPVGLDALVYRNAGGECRLKPIVEINPRHTMGRLTTELMRYVTSGSHGLFRLVSRNMAHAEGCPDFPAYSRLLTERFPLVLAGEPNPRIREGALCLNEPARAQVCLATFRVSRNLESLLDLASPTLVASRRPAATLLDEQWPP